MAFFSSIDHTKRLFLTGSRAPYRALHFCKEASASIDYFSASPPRFGYTRVYQVWPQTAFKCLYEHRDMLALANNHALTACPAFLRDNFSKMFIPGAWVIDAYCHECNMARDDNVVAQFVGGSLRKGQGAVPADSDNEGMELDIVESDSDESGYDSPVYIPEYM